MSDAPQRVFLVVLIEIDDWQRYQDAYVPPTLEIIRKHGGRILSAVDGGENLEGDLVKGRSLIIEFPNDDAMRGFYYDPEYEPIKALRKTIARTSVFVMPEGRRLTR